MTRLRLFAPLAAAAALAAAGCGDDNDEGSATTPARGYDAAAATPAEAPRKLPRIGNAKDLSQKPQIGRPEGPPPTRLVKQDLVEGEGPAIKAGQAATVQYVGVNWSDGNEFDASWNRGQPFSFPLGQGQVIPGWDRGLVGMRAGGRRLLVIPPEQAYGPQGSPPAIGPNETLVFVVDLERIG